MTLKRIFVGVLAGMLFPAAAFAKVEANIAFAPAAVPAGSPSRASIIVQNTEPVQGTQLSFSLSLPEGLHLHEGGNLWSNCGGAPQIEEVNGSIRLSMTGGEIPAAHGENPGSCSIALDLIGTRARTFTMVIPAGAVEAEFAGAVQVNGSAAQASVTATMTPIAVEISSPLGNHAKGGQIIQRSYRFTNSNRIPITGMNFDLDMSVIGNNFRAVEGPAVENSCGGSFSVQPLPPRGSENHPDTLVRIAGAGIPAKASCTLTFQVTTVRNIRHAYRSLGQNQQLPANLLTADQGVSNSLSNEHWSTFRNGVQTTMLIDGKALANLDVVSGQEAEVVFTASSHNAETMADMVVQMRVPPAVEVLDMASSCGGSLARTSTLVTWHYSHPAAPEEPTTGWKTADCSVILRVKAKEAGNHAISVVNGYYPHWFVNGSSATISANDSLIAAEAWFDRDEVLAADSAIFRVRLINKSDQKVLENISVANAVGSSIYGALIGPIGRVEDDCQAGPADISEDRTEIRFDGIALAAGASCTLGYQVTLGSGALNLAQNQAQKKTNAIGLNDITYRIEGGEDVAWNATVSDTIDVRTRVVSRMWWKLASSALRACNVGSSQAARSRDIGTRG